MSQQPADPNVFFAFNNSLTGGQPGSANGPARIMEYADFLRLGAKVGFTGADVTLGNAMKLSATEVRALMTELKLKPGLVSQIPSMFVKDDAVYQTNFKRLEDMIKFAAALGCNCTYAAVLPSYDTPKVELRKIFKDRMMAVSAMLLKENFTFGLKFVGLASFRKRQPFEFIWRMDEMLEFVKECGPNIGVMLDSWHWHHAGATPADIVAAGKSRITSVHVADAKAAANPEEVRDDQRVLPGEGKADLVGFFQALKKIGYEGAISPEPIGRFPRDTWDGEAGKQALEATKTVMRKAGYQV
jgi:sugar phosphate isomerase/epimerase